MLNIMRWFYSNQILVSFNILVFIYYSRNFFKFVMKLIYECCYCDIKVDDFNDLFEDLVELIILVYEDIFMKIVEWLKVSCFSIRLINFENMGFEQLG